MEPEELVVRLQTIWLAYWGDKATVAVHVATLEVVHQYV